MSVKELVVVPKQKFDSLTRSKDNQKEMKSVGCQTDIISSRVEEATKPDIEDSVNGESRSLEKMHQRIKDGIPGKLQKRPRQNKRKTLINWIPY